MSSPPQHLSFFSDVKQKNPNFKPNVTCPPTGKQRDLLVDNTPYSRFYHVTVSDSSRRPQYDLVAIAEPTGAITLPVNEHNQIALIRQWRSVPSSVPGSKAFDKPLEFPHGFYSTEVPRGFPEHGESHADAAAREVREELGVATKKVWQLGWCNFNTAIAMTDIPVFAVLVDHTSQVVDQKDGTEVIENVEWVSMEELGDFVMNGSIRCGLTLAAVSYAFAARGRIAQFIKER
ncbi:NUDIX hydrolase [Gracilaria domingensis]|nr:NUDIX hydrolase [Gracilaria domingensis]